MFLLDQGLPRSAVTHLASANVAAVHVGGIGMGAADDATILDEARRRSLIVVTLDADFHSLLAAAGAVAPSVIRLRIEGLKGDDVARILVQVIHLAADELSRGSVVSVTVDRVRVRLLPLA